MGLIHDTIMDPNVASSFGGSLAGLSYTGGSIISHVVPSAGPLSPNIIARRQQPLDEEEMEEGTE